jgi:rod shape-determining protein MreD
MNQLREAQAMIDRWLGRGFTFIAFTLYVALILTVLPLVEWLDYVRPSWMLLIVLFWVQVLPSRFGIGFAFTIGLITDLLTDSLWGLHSLSIVLTVFVQLLLLRQIRVFTGFQQFLSILVLSFLYLLIFRLLENFFLEDSVSGLVYWTPALINALLWPWFFIVMDNLKTLFHIYESNN